MVVFTCNHCGESLQKPKVEKHYNFVCRTVAYLTCVDCFKDFKGNEYVTHTKCVTEEERYSAKGSHPNGIINKGEVKQETWIEMIKSIINTEKNLKPPHLNLLKTISSYNNVPRKNLNFCCLGGRVNMSDVEKVWDIIEKYKSNQSKQTEQVNLQNDTKENFNEGYNSDRVEKGPEIHKDSNEVNGEIVKKKRNKKKSFNNESADPGSPKKQKLSRPEDELVIEDNTIEQPIFNFEESILNILTSRKSISLKKLERKVLNAYIKYTGDLECTPKVIKKFNKRLKKVKNIEIVEDRVIFTAKIDV